MTRYFWRMYARGMILNCENAGEAWPRPYGCCSSSHSCRGGAMPRPSCFSCIPLHGGRPMVAPMDVLLIWLSEQHQTKQTERAFQLTAGPRSLRLFVFRVLTRNGTGGAMPRPSCFSCIPLHGGRPMVAPADVLLIWLSEQHQTKQTERACPFPTTSRSNRREQACLFRLWLQASRRSHLR